MSVSSTPRTPHRVPGLRLLQQRTLLEQAAHRAHVCSNDRASLTDATRISLAALPRARQKSTVSRPPYCRLRWSKDSPFFDSGYLSASFQLSTSRPFAVKKIPRGEPRSRSVV